MMRSFLLALTSVLSKAVLAGHLLGGDMTYTHLGNDLYEIRVQVFKECFAGADLDPSISLGIFREDGSLFTTLNPFLEPVINIPVESGNPCIIVPPDLCIQRGLYIATVTLPQGMGAYTVAHHRCCRGEFVANLSMPQEQGSTFTIVIPDASIHGPNSSPAFDDYPDLALCLSFENTVIQTATDPDGDELVFELAAPFQGGSTLNPIPPPEPPPYTPVTWGPAYSVANMMNTVVPLSIDPVTGTLVVTPASLNRFVNGVLLSEVLRDLTYVVTACEGVQSAITDITALVRCEGLDVQFENSSVGSDLFHWDFGVEGTQADTSNEVEPHFTFPVEGVYDVTLIGLPGSLCSDTAVMTYEIYEPRTVAFTPPQVQCDDGHAIELNAVGFFLNDATFLWDFPGGTSSDLTVRTPQVTYADTGVYLATVTVEEFGCSDTYTDTIQVMPLPEAKFSTLDTAGCQPYAVLFTDSSTAATPLRYAWEFGDGGTSTEAQPLHYYSEAGIFDVRLTVHTDNGCIATDTLFKEALVESWALPDADLHVEPREVSILDPVVTFTDSTQGIVWRELWVEGQAYSDSVHVHRFSDAGWHDILLTVVTEHGCIDTALSRVFVTDHLVFAPTAFTPNDDDINEVWAPSVKGARKYRLEIFDRWGRLRFTSTDPTEVWTGDDADEGVYHYKLWVSEFSSIEKEYNGHFSLFR
jgi:gliding motility-associated-like protein